MIRRVFGVAALVVMSSVLWGQSPATKPAAKAHDPKGWEKEIAKFEVADEKGMPAPGGVEFVGSSTIRIWDLKAGFPGVEAINRGFGGSWSCDGAYYADRIVVKYRPRLVVFYAGDNDIAGGAKAEDVARSFEEFVSKVKAGVPGVKIVFLSIKPSVARWKKWPEMEKANGLVKAFAERTPGVSYVDMTGEMLGGDGKPRAELFRKDGLHMNDKGYEIWNAKLRPVVEGK